MRWPSTAPTTVTSGETGSSSSPTRTFQPTDARSHRVKRYAREALAVWLDLSAADELDTHGVRVLDLIELPGGMADDVSQLREQRVTAEQLRREVAVRTADAARRLLAAGWSTRDIAAVLDVSAGYVSKVARGERAS